MRTFKHLFEQIITFENLYQAWRNAARGKRGKVEVADFEFNLEENLFALQAELIEGTYTPGAYRSFHIQDPKPRLISAAPFRDRVVHHAL
jgi:RNA-directed DNA polymerase